VKLFHGVDYLMERVNAAGRHPGTWRPEQMPVKLPGPLAAR